jgi:hypothetical protein
MGIPQKLTKAIRQKKKNKITKCEYEGGAKGSTTY